MRMRKVEQLQNNANEVALEFIFKLFMDCIAGCVFMGLRTVNYAIFMCPAIAFKLFPYLIMAQIADKGG